MPARLTSEFSPIPLARLSEQCAQCLRQRIQGRCEACRELAHRALCCGNDAAWDSLLAHLWPFMLRWIYAAQPEVTPSVADALGYRALCSFRSQWTNRSDLATNFPAFPALLHDLHRCFMQIMASGLL
jgi:hypothetical protein